VLLGVEKGDARSTWTWKRKCQLSLANWMQFGWIKPNLYERYKKQDQTFVAIGSEEDERAIKKINEKDADKEEEKKDESAHEEVQEEEGAKKRKLGTRRKLKAKRRKHGSSLTREDDDLKICLHIAPDEDKVIDVESLDCNILLRKEQSSYMTQLLPKGSFLQNKG
ncbi:hypothetical protein Tco_0604622, partial [Tanacetum coccineum]